MKELLESLGGENGISWIIALHLVFMFLIMVGVWFA